MKLSKRITIGDKMYLFVVVTVVLAVASVCTFSFLINARQIDTYFKRLAKNSAETYASFVDVEYLAALREAAESEEFQEIREKAEEEEDEAPVEEFLQRKGLWEKYVSERQQMITYQNSMEDIKYLYIVAWGDKDAKYDMYLLDADDQPIYETGYYEEREAEFEGVDPAETFDPVINNGDWGWLCSAYAAVRDASGRIICHVGCDVDMKDVMSERRLNLTYMIIGAMICALIVLIGAIIFVRRVVVNPLNRLTAEMEKFSPAVNKSYEEAGVIDLKIRGHDEIQDIYQEIRSMQTEIIDYIADITVIQRDMEKAEDEVRNKDKELGKISREAYRDALTGVGNKAAYSIKSNELNDGIVAGRTEFAIVMVDVNGLKNINDAFGHSAGDVYLKGCCHIICEVFKHSPIYRIGGDEFVAVLTGEDYNTRLEKMKELRDSYKESYEQQDQEPWLRFSAATGMADCRRDDHTVEFVFRRADKEMYEEKIRFKKTTGQTEGPRDRETGRSKEDAAFH